MSSGTNSHIFGSRNDNDSVPWYTECACLLDKFEFAFKLYCSSQFWKVLFENSGTILFFIWNISIAYLGTWFYWLPSVFDLCHLPLHYTMAKRKKKIKKRNAFVKNNSYNRFNNILRLFDVLPNFPFFTSGKMCSYYLYTWYIPVPLRVAERLKTLRPYTPF